MENTYTLSTQVLYRNFENGYMTCDITISKPYTRKVDEEIIRHPASRICGVKLKVENNIEILEKVKSLRKNTLLWVTYTTDMPLRDVSDNMVIIKVLTQKEYDTIAEPYKKLQKEMWRNMMKKL